MLRAVLAALVCYVLALAPNPLLAQTSLQSLLQTQKDAVLKPSRAGVGAVLDTLVASNLPGVQDFLEKWQERQVVLNTQDGLFYFATGAQGDTLLLQDIDSGASLSAPKSALTDSRPNGGVRKEIAGALVRFQLSGPDIEKRRAAVEAIARAPSADVVGLLQASAQAEPDPALKAQKQRLAQILVARFAPDSAARIAAITGFSGALSLDIRAMLNQILETRPGVAPARPNANIAEIVQPGSDALPIAAAYEQLVAADLAPPMISPAQIKETLAQNISAGAVAGIPLAQLAQPDRRIAAYQALVAQGKAAPLVGPDDMTKAVNAHVFYLAYIEPDRAITDAARATLHDIETAVAFNKGADLALDALSLASIYFLAAIGLAITFGVMGVINMAHGEFIMIGAYTGYVVQQFVPDYTLSLIVALPLAFAVTFGAGVAMERLVIRWLYHRPLETLLATFGISIALQQLAKNIFGTQARPLTSPAWLDGAWVINDVVQISYIRIAIFVLALLFLGLILVVLKRTRLGLEVRAVTQNPGMAASMGINPDRINMLTFGLGSGIAGIAGVAIGLYAKVTSEIGSDYIVQSFMTVVVGGVGNVWGTLAGAGMIGGLQKGIEWLNPSNTLAAQTYMILFIILFIQFRPKGIVALKGRAAGD